MSKEVAEVFYDNNKDQIDNWLKKGKGFSKVETDRTGGSSYIYNIIYSNENPVCLKIMREFDKQDYIKYYLKYLEEILFSISSSKNGYVLPIFNSSLKEVSYNDKIIVAGINKLIEYITPLKIEDDFNRNFVNKVNELKLKDIILLIENKSNTLIHIGFIMRKGFPLEDCLAALSTSFEFKKRNPDKIPEWLETALSPYIDKNVDKRKLESTLTHHFTHTIAFWVPQFVSQCIFDILNSIKDIHDSGLFHLDIKESNIMVLPSTTRSDLLPIKFVLFDFGSAQEQAATLKDDWKFETTYQYLPKEIQEIKSPSSFTSDKRVEIKKQYLIDTDISPEMMDLHALSQIIMNFLASPSFKKISAFLSENDYEESFSFAQLLTVNFRKKDADSIYPVNIIKDEWNNKPNLAQKAIDIWNYAKELEKKANKSWIDLLTAIQNTNRNKIYSTKGNIRQSITLKEKDSYIHPATKIKEFEDEFYSKKMNKISSTDDLVEIEKELNQFKNESGFRNESLSLKLLGTEYDFSSLLNTKLLKRLENIKQLGLTFRTHHDKTKRFAFNNRLDHSIGTAEIARLFLIALLKNSGWFRFRYKKDDGLFLLITALLHDIGHFPFSHCLENTKIFPYHEDNTNAIILGNLNDLLLTSTYDSDIFKDWESPQKKEFTHYKRTKKNKIDIFWPDDEETDEPFPLRYCDAKDIIPFHKILAKILKFYDTDLNTYAEWHSNMTKSFKTDRERKRLIFRVFHSVIDGPIDADKLHYLANDSINCYIEYSKIVEGDAFRAFLNSVRVPIRQLDGNPTMSYCLGINEDTSNIPQILMFLRASMFGEIYWSQNVRIKAALLKYFLYKSLKIYIKYKAKKPTDASMREIWENLGNWIRGTDEEAIKSIKQLAEITEEIIKNPKNKVEDNDKVDIDKIIKLLIGDETDSSYEEICRIYPSDKIAYDNILSFIGPKKIKTNKDEIPIRILDNDFFWYDSELTHQIIKIVMECLNIKRKDLVPGSILIDIPDISESKKNEFKRFALVDSMGFGRPIGTIWDAIENYLNEKTKIIRVLLIKGIVSVGREEKIALRESILSTFS